MNRGGHASYEQTFCRRVIFKIIVVPLMSLQIPCVKYITGDFD
jgi:hypothetical protein